MVGILQKDFAGPERPAGALVSGGGSSRPGLASTRSDGTRKMRSGSWRRRGSNWRAPLATRTHSRSSRSRRSERTCSSNQTSVRSYLENCPLAPTNSPIAAGCSIRWSSSRPCASRDSARSTSGAHSSRRCVLIRATRPRTSLPEHSWSTAAPAYHARSLSRWRRTRSASGRSGSTARCASRSRAPSRTCRAATSPAAADARRRSTSARSASAASASASRSTCRERAHTRRRGLHRNS